MIIVAISAHDGVIPTDGNRPSEKVVWGRIAGGKFELLKPARSLTLENISRTGTAAFVFVAIIVAILMFGGIWGFWGVFFAIPLATLVKVLIAVWPRSRPAEV